VNCSRFPTKNKLVFGRHPFGFAAIPTGVWNVFPQSLQLNVGMVTTCN
jgi:hypothetical protein